MTWSRIKATGSGTVDYRLEIAGCQHEWVTNSRITHADGKDGRDVFSGLQFNGLKISEKAILKDCWVQVSGITAKIKPTTDAEETMAAFTRTPVPIGYLAATDDVPGLEYNSTEITLDNGLTLGGGFYHVASECFYTDGSGNTIERAKWGTTAQRHYIVYGATSAISVPVYRYPPTLEGRRATLYVYGEGDDPDGDGSAIWRGIVSRPPRLDRDGMTWSIQLDSIVKSLDQRVAAAEGLEYRVRGIYHSALSPMSLEYFAHYDEYTDPDTSGARPAPALITGFFDDDNALQVAVNEALEERLSLRDELISATYALEDGSPRITCVNHGDMSGEAFFISAGFQVRSYLEGYLMAILGSRQLVRQAQRDGVVGDYLFEEPGAITGIEETIIERFGNAEGKFITPLGAEHRHKPIFEYPLSPVRAMLGAVPSYGNPPGAPNAAEEWPGNRLYLNIVDGLEADDILLVKNGEVITPIKVTAVDVDERWISAEIQNGEKVLWFDAATVIIPSRVFASDTGLPTFLGALIGESINANDGDTPYVPPGDISLATFINAYLTEAIDDFWKRRNYVFLKPIPLKKILQEELKAIGWMLRLESNGQIGCTPLPLLASNAQATPIGEHDILLPARGQVGDWPTWTIQEDGLVNTVSVRLGYKPLDDDFDDKFDFTVRSISSIAEHKNNNRGDVEIAPRSTPGVQRHHNLVNLTPQLIASWVQNYLRVLSMDYATVSILVPFRFFDLRVGDPVSVTCSLIPNGLGGRGVVSKKAVVVGREWNLDPATNAMGVLTLYFPREVSSGYAPSAHVTGQSNVSGDTWDLHCDDEDDLNLRLSEAGDGDVTRHFAVGDKVQVVKRNDGLIPTTVTGAVLASGTELIQVALDAEWTPGSDDWVLEFQADGGTLTEHQQGFTFVADGDRTLVDGQYARRYL